MWLWFGRPFIKLFTISMMRLMMMMRVHGDIIITPQKIIFTTKSKQTHCLLPTANLLLQIERDWAGTLRIRKKSENIRFVGILARSGWFLSQLLISELKSKSVNFQFSQISRFLCLATNLNEMDEPN